MLYCVKMILHLCGQHDSTVGAVLDAMKVFPGQVPPYASAVLVELHEADGEQCVKIRYRNDTTRPPFVFVHPGNGFVGVFLLFFAFLLHMSNMIGGLVFVFCCFFGGEGGWFASWFGFRWIFFIYEP